jgi:hypothetical protein
VSSPKLDEASVEVTSALEATSTFLTETSEVLDSVPNETKEARPALYRAEAAVETGSALVGVIDPRVVPQALASEIRNQAEALRDQVRLVPNEEGNVGPKAEELLRKRRRRLLVACQSLGGRVRGVEGEMKAAEERVAQMAEQTTIQTDEVKQRLDELRAESDAAKERVDGLIGEQDTKFTEAQEERRKRFDDSLDSAKAALEKTQGELEERRSEAVRAGILDADQSPESVLGKAVIALILGGVAGYAAGIARRHRERAATARRLLTTCQN